jgi:hypothetical protein
MQYAMPVQAVEQTDTQKTSNDAKEAMIAASAMLFFL